MTTFASMDELKARLDWDMEPDEERTAAGALEDLSEWARYYGRPWTAENAPRLVRSIVLSATVRYLRNPDGYTQSRAGDETLTWTDRGEASGSATLSEQEIASLKRLARPAAISSVVVSAYGPRAGSMAGYVPVAGGGQPFPYYSNASPW